MSLSVGRLELAADFAFAFDHGVKLDADFRNARPAGTVKRIPGTSAGMGVRGRWLPAGHDAEGWGLVFGGDMTRGHAGGLRKSQVFLFGEWEFGADTTVLAASAGLRRGSRTRGTRLSWGADATAGLRHTRLRVDLCEYNVFTGGCVFAARASDTDVTPYLGLAVEFGAAFTSERGPSTAGAGVRFRLGATWSPRTRFRFQGAAADTGSYDPSGLVLGLTFTLTL